MSWRAVNSIPVATITSNALSLMRIRSTIACRDLGTEDHNIAENNSASKGRYNLLIVLLFPAFAVGRKDLEDGVLECVDHCRLGSLFARSFACTGLYVWQDDWNASRTTIVSTSDILISSHRHAPLRNKFTRKRVNGRNPHRLPIWLVLIGFFTPKTMAIFIGGLMFSPGRLAISILFVPALGKFVTGLARQYRSVVGADLLMLALVAWMLGATFFQTSSSSASPLVSAGSEALELFGAYIIGRAYLYGRPALEMFMRALVAVSVVLTAIALIDVVSGRYLVYETTAQLFGAIYYGAMERSGFVRAQSTFDHPILFGAFCCVCAAMFLHWEANRRRLVYCGVCVCGILLSVSSGPLMAFAFMLGAYWYGQIMRNFGWRWKAFWAVIFAFLCALFSLSNSPVGWIIDHLTFDVENGYFRLATWYATFDQIALSPWVGFFRDVSGNEFLDRTVDSVWLVCALTYGLPMMILLILVNLAAFWRNGPNPRPRSGDDASMSSLRTGFTVALVMFMFIGLTVHFWNAMWMFWGLCIAIRASLREHSLASAKRLARPVQRGGVLARSG
jgi:hypothetical protein